MIIVTGGEGEGYNYLTSVEVLSPTGVRLPCSVPPLPLSAASRYHHTQDGEVACGGQDYEDATSCSTLTASGWTKSHDLLYERRKHASWNSPDGLLLMGGENYYSYLTTELLANTSTSRRMSNRDHTESPYQTSTSSFDLDYDIS